MAVRREREQREREKDGVRDRPAAWDSGDRQDRRWALADDRDGRNKRAAGRERKPDEAKDKGDRKDRDREREREREKEPAWMDTYIPSTGSNGLGRAPGDLDGIQAFKREIKEREQKEQSAAQDGDHSSDLEGKTHTSEGHLDEIQLFKLMMKREEQKKIVDESPLAGPSLLADAPSATKDMAPTKGRSKFCLRQAECANMPSRSVIRNNHRAAPSSNTSADFVTNVCFSISTTVRPSSSRWFSCASVHVIVFIVLQYPWHTT